MENSLRRAHTRAALMVCTLVGWSAPTLGGPRGQSVPRPLIVTAPVEVAQRPGSTLYRGAPCPLPNVPAGDQLIAFGAYDADSISSAWVGSPDQETNLMDVLIEPGKQPLYIVLTSYESMVWRFRGATSRVRHVVVSSYETARRAEKAEAGPVRRYRYSDRTPAEAWRIIPTSGVIGLPRNKVVIAPSHCPQHFYNIGRADTALAAVYETLRRRPDKIAATYTAQRVSLPSGSVVKAKPGAATVPVGFDRDSWGDAARFWPGGLVSVDPRTIVAAAPTAGYEVLPSQMGISQLIGAGAIEPLGGEEFRLLRSIPRLPPAMGGAHSVTLILAPGVPRPPGDPGHSCIMDEKKEEQFRKENRCPPSD